MRITRRWTAASCVATALAFGTPYMAAQTKPANATALCKDGTYSTATSKQGACSEHGGIQTWYADDKGVKGDAAAAGKSTKDAAASAGKATAGAAKTVGKATKSGAEGTANATGAAAKKTEEGAKTAGKATANAAGTAAHKTEAGAKKVGNATANAIKPRPSDAPADATAKCKDGTFSKTTQHTGACSGHGGVADWYK